MPLQLRPQNHDSIGFSFLGGAASPSRRLGLYGFLLMVPRIVFFCILGGGRQTLPDFHDRFFIFPGLGHRQAHTTRIALFCILGDVEPPRQPQLYVFRVEDLAPPRRTRHYFVEFLGGAAAPVRRLRKKVFFPGRDSSPTQTTSNECISNIGGSAAPPRHARQYYFGIWTGMASPPIHWLFFSSASYAKDPPSRGR